MLAPDLDTESGVTDWLESSCRAINNGSNKLSCSVNISYCYINLQVDFRSASVSCNLLELALCKLCNLAGAWLINSVTGLAGSWLS